MLTLHPASKRFLKEKHVPEKPDLFAFGEEENHARGRKAWPTYSPEARSPPSET